MTVPAPNITAHFSHHDYCLSFISRFGKNISKKYALVSDTVCLYMLSHVRLFVNTWTVAHRAPLSMGFSRQEYWNRLPFLPLGDLPDPGSEPVSLLLCRRILYPVNHQGSPICQRHYDTQKYYF